MGDKDEFALTDPDPGQSIRAYQLSLSDVASTPETVTSFSVVLFDGQEQEVGSDSETTTETVIAPDQSLTWTVTSTFGTYPGGMPPFTTCQYAGP